MLVRLEIGAQVSEIDACEDSAEDLPHWVRLPLQLPGVPWLTLILSCQLRNRYGLPTYVMEGVRSVSTAQARELFPDLMEAA